MDSTLIDAGGEGCIPYLSHCNSRGWVGEWNHGRGGVGRYCISARWITRGLPSSTLTQIHRKSLCLGPRVISALGVENGVQPVNEGGHISHQSPQHSRVTGA